MSQVPQIMKVYKVQNFKTQVLTALGETPSFFYLDNPSGEKDPAYRLIKRTTTDTFVSTDIKEAEAWLETRVKSRISRHMQILQTVRSLETSIDVVFLAKMKRDETWSIESFEVVKAGKTLKTRAKRIQMTKYGKKQNVSVYINENAYSQSSPYDQLAFGTWVIRDDTRKLEDWIKARISWLETISTKF